MRQTFCYLAACLGNVSVAAVNSAVAACATPLILMGDRLVDRAVSGESKRTAHPNGNGTNYDGNYFCFEY